MTIRTKLILAGLIGGLLLFTTGYVDAALILLTIGVLVICIDIGDN